MMPMDHGSGAGPALAGESAANTLRAQRPDPDALMARLEELRSRFGHLGGADLLRATLVSGPLTGGTALVSSFGVESAVLLHLVASIDPGIPVIFLDTGKLFPETLAYRDQLEALFGLTDLRTIRPDPRALDRLDADGTLWSRTPDHCCHIRKTAPLDHALEEFGAWINGRKRFHGDVRATLQAIEGEPSTGRIKLNPLANWSAADLDAYRKTHRLPPHPLAGKGYRSIGCAPCTRPVGASEDPRAGRWWGIDKSECGIHRPGV
jgi:phosphoadenosine phosphosulfate reductase